MSGKYYLLGIGIESKKRRKSVCQVFFNVGKRKNTNNPANNTQKEKNVILLAIADDFQFVSAVFTSGTSWKNFAFLVSLPLPIPGSSLNASTIITRASRLLYVPFVRRTST